MRRPFLLILTLVIIVSACACGGNNKVVPDPGDKFERYTTDLSIDSKILGRKVNYSITLPKSYVSDKERRYPVVYMLHGYGDDNNSWNGNWLHGNDKIFALENNGLSDMIYVFPQGFTTYYCNFHTGAFNYMDMFIQELIPYIDATYRTIPDREHRSITGYSMGGFGAMVLAEKHPETFLCSAPLSMSFRTDDQYMSESQQGWDKQWGEIFGGKGQAGEARITPYYMEHCPYYQFVPANKETLEKVHWFFTCGDDEEQLLIANDTLHVQLRDFGFKHEFRVDDGAHTSKYWLNALGEVLPMFDYYMNGGNQWPGIGIDYRVPTVDLQPSGAFVSERYNSVTEGKIVMILAHKGLEKGKVEMLTRAMTKEYSLKPYAVIPMDVTKGPFAEVLAEALNGYTYETLGIMAIGEAGITVFENRNLFTNIYFAEAVLGSVPASLSGEQKYCFCCTDESDSYRDFGALYRTCKRSDIQFEYRVINAISDAESNIMNCIYTLQNTFIY